MPSFGILCTAMFRFERERVLHCYLYRGRQEHIPPFPSIGDGEHISNQRFLRYDGSTPGPFPLICPTQRILNSCYALIKYRRVQTSLHRIIIRFESWLLNIILATLLLPFSSFYAHCYLKYSKYTYATTVQLRFMGQKLCMPCQSQDTGASDRTM